MIPFFQSFHRPFFEFIFFIQFVDVTMSSTEPMSSRLPSLFVPRQ